MDGMIDSSVGELASHDGVGAKIKVGQDLDMSSVGVKGIVGKKLLGMDNSIPTTNVDGNIKMTINMTADTAVPEAAYRAFLRALGGLNA
jgi:hypothetical protein